jgi:hypothetical protein
METAPYLGNIPARGSYLRGFKVDILRNSNNLCHVLQFVHSVSVVEFSAMEYAKRENTNPAPGELWSQCESERRADQTDPATLCDVLLPGSAQS